MSGKTWQDKLNSERVKEKGWYGCIAPDGWREIVEETDEMLAFIDPEYQIHQVKEKFGTLRYYFGSVYEHGSIESKIMHAITNSAEAKSSHTCEICGKYGETRTSQYYIRTLCDSCELARMN